MRWRSRCDKTRAGRRKRLPHQEQWSVFKGRAGAFACHLSQLLALFILTGSMAHGVVVDRIAVVAGKHAIKLSDIERDLRVTEFLNREPLNLGPEARRKAADRLVDQVLIADAITSGGFQRPTPADADAFLKRLRDQRFAGSETRLQQAIATYGLSEATLRAQLLWQLDVLRFIDQRFRPAVVVTEDDIRAYYNQHRAELARQYPQANSLEALEPKIRQSLEGERVNQDFERWLAQARQRNRVEYREGAFQ